jgi:hypothetical protein
VPITIGKFTETFQTPQRTLACIMKPLPARDETAVYLKTI